jgi:maltose/maltodextrin transport system substrate-binding protein
MNVGKASKTMNLPLMFLALCLVPTRVFAWTNGELLIWMDNERGSALAPIIEKFKTDLGINVTIETPENITDSFPIAAQAGKGPDIVVWAHDKVGEWADAGLIAPVETSDQFRNKFFPISWQAVQHHQLLWGYPIALETVTLIYNKKLLDGPAPVALSQLGSVRQMLERKHPGAATILWDLRSPYYSWGILASGGGYVFARKGADYDLQNVGLATPGTIAALSKIITLTQLGILPKTCSYSDTEELMGQGKLAMMISGPWAWANLIQKGIDFGLSQIPGVNGNVGRPFVGVSAAYLNRSSPNQDLAKEFLEGYLLTDDGLATMDKAKPIGIPALISFYHKLAQDNPRLRELKASVDYGQVMPNVPENGPLFQLVSSSSAACCKR